MRVRLSLKFYLKTNSIKWEKMQIYARLTIDRKKAEFATGIYVPPQDWDEAKERHRRKSHVINEDLVEIESDIQDIKRNLEREDKPVTAKILKAIYTGQEILEETLLSYYESHLKKMIKGGEHGQSSIDLYRQTLDKIAEFLAKERKEKDIPLKHVNYKFINEFDLFLIAYPLSRNTVAKHHSRLRTVLISAFKEELITRKPYEKFTIRKEHKVPVYLTLDEVQRIISHDFGESIGLERARDISIFSVFTGIRFQAAQDLTPDNVKQTEEGEYYLEFNPGKQKLGEEKLFQVPLFEPAYQVIQKYDRKERIITGRLFPKMNNGNINAYLKTIADVTGLQKHITHHTARHTFASTILLRGGASLEETSHFLTHSSVKMTEHYARGGLDYLLKTTKRITQNEKKNKSGNRRKN